MYWPASAVSPGGRSDRNRHGPRRRSGVDERDRDRADTEHPLQVGRLELELRRQVARRLDAGVGDRRDHQRIDDVLDARRGEQIELVGETVRVQHDDQSHDDHKELQTQFGERQHDQADLPVSPRHVGDVQDRRQADDDDRHRQLDVPLRTCSRSASGNGKP
jgi:hypothetical protein